MAIYHATVKTFSRGKGQSAIAAAAYRAGMRLTDPATGRHHNYRYRGGVVETRCIAPHDAPDWAFDPSALWAAAEAAEKRKDATLAREFEVALPHELTDEQRMSLAMDLADELVTRYRFAMQVSVHRPAAAGSLNDHVHMLATTRRIGPEGLDDKTRELDGGPTGRAEIEWARQMIAKITNQHLEQAAIDARVDHRTLKAQAEEAESRGDLAAALGLTREPTIHLGKHATALERKGEATALGAFNDAIGQALPKAADLLSHPGEIRLTPGEQQPTSSKAPTLATANGRRLAAKQAHLEARMLWEAGIDVPPSVVFIHTPRILRYYAARSAAYLAIPAFAVDFRQLVRAMKQLIHDTGQLMRQKVAEALANARWLAATQELAQFDTEHPKPAVWSRSDWKQRRDRRVGAVNRYADAWREAQEGVSDEAQQRYTQQVQASAKGLEDWSAILLERYPVDADGWTFDVVRFEPKAGRPASPPSDETDEGSSSDARPRRPKF